MKCPDCQEELVAYLEGLLSPEREVDVARHLEVCPVCRAQAEEHARQLAAPDGCFAAAFRDRGRLGQREHARRAGVKLLPGSAHPQQ